MKRKQNFKYRIEYEIALLNRNDVNKWMYEIHNQLIHTE